MGNEYETFYEPTADFSKITEWDVVGQPVRGHAQPALSRPQ